MNNHRSSPSAHSTQPLALMINNPGTLTELLDTQFIPLHILENTDFHYLVPFLQDTEAQQQINITGHSRHQENVTGESLTYLQNNGIGPSSLSTNNAKNVSGIDFINKTNQEKEITQQVKQQFLKDCVHISDRSVRPRAEASVPSPLALRRGVVCPCRTLHARIRFGPVQGIKTNMSILTARELVLNASTDQTPLFLLKENSGTVVHIDVSDKDKSNWFCLLPLGKQDTANVWLYEDNNELYGITTQVINSRKPLMLGYSKQYAEDHGFPQSQPTMDITAVFAVGNKQWKCYECQRSLRSAALLQRHINTHHKEDKYIPRRRYRCKYCTRTFCRLFTMKRHVNNHCLKKEEMSDSPTKQDSNQIPPTDDTNVSKSDENRMPSDESFQNYTTGLDFPTNLFDTDRISNLDISGHSRSEGDSNYLGYKDDNLSNDLGFAKIHSAENEIPPNNMKIENVISEPILESCPYCDQVLVKEKKQQHYRECIARRSQCECGRLYTNKSSLTNHIITKHTNLPAEEVVSKKEKEHLTKQYKCDQCPFSFKRRGMLVLHAWRVHGAACAAPLRRAVRHYLCAVCPKLYRSAAKRDSHVRAHHPGADASAARCVEGAVRELAPAQCWACPRQYASRAKLLQHARAHHPHQIPPPAPSTKPKYVKEKNNFDNDDAHK